MGEFPYLDKRVALVCGKYETPFLMEIKEFEVNKNVSKEKITKHMEPILKELGGKFLKKEPKVEFLNKDHVVSFSRKSNGLDTEKKKFLMETFNEPRPIVSIGKKIGLSSSKLKRIKNELEKAGHIILHKINTGLQGGNLIVPEITEKGCIALGVTYKPQRSRGSGFEHFFWVKTIEGCIKSLRNGRIYVEKEYRDTHTDLWVEMEDKKIVFEVSISSKPEDDSEKVNNLLKVFDILILSYNSNKRLNDARELILKNICEENLKNVRFVILGKFLKKELIEEENIF